MSRTVSILGSLLFTIVVPGTVAGILPALVSGWHTVYAPGTAYPARIAGVILLISALPVLLHAIYSFAVQGLGTPAPIAPTRHLVVTGPNRYVRNPMYLAVVVLIAGQALLLGSLPVFWYGLLVALGQALFVHFYEEPTLRTTFGDEYDRYRAAVRAWVPRPTPWRQ